MDNFPLNYLNQSWKSVLLSYLHEKGIFELIWQNVVFYFWVIETEMSTLIRSNISNNMSKWHNMRNKLQFNSIMGLQEKN